MRTDWQEIDTVLLDMDGTLLDLHFDNHFWQAHVPLRYAEARGLPDDVAHEEVMARYHARAGTLEWYSVDFWATELELDIMRLKEEVAHLIAVHPSVTEFLGFLRAAGKRVVLATNAHHKSLTRKMARTGLEPHFDLLVTSHELGVPKEAQAFWEKLRAIEPFDPARTVLVDDSLSVLDSARGYGIRHLVAVRTPDTRLPPKDTGGYFAIDSFAELIAYGGFPLLPQGDEPEKRSEWPGVDSASPQGLSALSQIRGRENRLELLPFGSVEVVNMLQRSPTPSRVRGALQGASIFGCSA